MGVGYKWLVAFYKGHVREAFQPSNLQELAAREDLSSAEVAALFIRIHNDKYRVSALVVALGHPWLNHPHAESVVRNCSPSL
ncbi:hypothetical protein TNCV_776031 [Trichonephila clavipes]|nr:hypothetical protein TNCV_776031 [Trichonephila clavipes]